MQACYATKDERYPVGSVVCVKSFKFGRQDVGSVTVIECSEDAVTKVNSTVLPPKSAQSFAAQVEAQASRVRRV